MISMASPKFQRQWKLMPRAERVVKRGLFKDSDKDGVPNRWDCKPRNPFKQDDEIAFGGNRARENQVPFNQRRGYVPDKGVSPYPSKAFRPAQACCPICGDCNVDLDGAGKARCNECGYVFDAR